MMRCGTQILRTRQKIAIYRGGGLQHTPQSLGWKVGARTSWPTRSARATPPLKPPPTGKSEWIVQCLTTSESIHLKPATELVTTTTSQKDVYLRTVERRFIPEEGVHPTTTEVDAIRQENIIAEAAVMTSLIPAIPISVSVITNNKNNHHI